MPPPAELLSSRFDGVERPGGTNFFGARWALALAVTLLALLSLTNAVRWAGPGPAKIESIIQQPVVPSTATAASPRPDLTAPDPGDTLP